MTVLATLITLVISGVLLHAGFGKFEATGAFRDTLAALGFPGPARRMAQFGVPTVEIAIAVALVWWPTSSLPRVAVLVLALGFAGVGLYALRLDSTIPCTCLGRLGAAGRVGEARLGWRQVVALPVWFTAVAVLQWQQPSWLALTAAEYVSGLVLALAVVRGVWAAQARRRAAGDRRALNQGIGVPAPMLADPEVVA